MIDVTLQPLTQGEKGKSVTLHFGHASVTATVAWADRRRTLQIPADVMAQWSLRPGQAIGVWQTPDRRDLHLGPLFGVLLEAPEPDPKVEEIRKAVVAQLGPAAELARVPLLLFSVHGVDLASERVTGQFYQGDGRWEQAVLPIPDVIYNRSTYPDPAVRQQASAIRTRLRKEWGVPFINPVAAFGKWTAHEALGRFRVTRRHNPAAIRLSTGAALQRFLGRHRHAFVKADSGTWGQSVLEVSALAGAHGPFHVRGYERDAPVQHTFATFADLFDFLSGLQAGSIWIVQQAIDLLTVLDRRFDLRLVLQKDDAGQWQVAQRLINWAGPGDVVTNNRQTAEFVPSEQFQDRWPAGKDAFAKLMDDAEHVARLAVQALEVYHGLFGEIGFDIGFDKDGHPWVFEANAKPFLAPGVGIRYPFAYARYLAKRLWRARHGVM